MSCRTHKRIQNEEEAIQAMTKSFVMTSWRVLLFDSVFFFTEASERGKRGKRGKQAMYSDMLGQTECLIDAAGRCVWLLCVEHDSVSLAELFREDSVFVWREDVGHCPDCRDSDFRSISDILVRVGRSDFPEHHPNRRSCNCCCTQGQQSECANAHYLVFVLQRIARLRARRSCMQ